MHDTVTVNKPPNNVCKFKEIQEKNILKLFHSLSSLWAGLLNHHVMSDSMRPCCV